LAAAAGPASQGELTLAAKRWSRVPDHSLVIGERRFGTPRPLHQALQAWAGRDVACLVRIRKNRKVQILETRSDGRAVGAVQGPAVTGAPAASLRRRELRAEGVGRDRRAEFYPALVDHPAGCARPSGAGVGPAIRPALGTGD